MPLNSIFNKTLKAPSRNILLWLQHYDFTMNYIIGSLLTVAGRLSRSPVKNKKSQIGNCKISSHIYLTNSNHLICDFRLQQFKNETKLGKTLLIHIQNGWPKSKNDVLNLIWSHFIHRQDLTYSNCIIYKGSRMIIPKSLFEDMNSYCMHTIWTLLKLKKKPVMFYIGQVLMLTWKTL